MPGQGEAPPSRGLVWRFGNMVAKQGESFVPVPLSEVADKRRTVPLDHPLVLAARAVNTCLGDDATA